MSTIETLISGVCCGVRLSFGNQWRKRNCGTTWTFGGNIKGEGFLPTSVMDENYFPKSCQWKTSTLPQCRDISWIFHHAVCQKYICRYLNPFQFLFEKQVVLMNRSFSTQNNRRVTFVLQLKSPQIWNYYSNSLSFKYTNYNCILFWYRSCLNYICFCNCSFP